MALRFPIVRVNGGWQRQLENTKTGKKMKSRPQIAGRFLKEKIYVSIVHRLAIAAMVMDRQAMKPTDAYMLMAWASVSIVGGPIRPTV